MDAAKKLEVLNRGMHFNDEIIAYSVVGEPLNVEQYRAHTEEGLKDIKEGRVATHKDFLEEIKRW